MIYEKCLIPIKARSIDKGMFAISLTGTVSHRNSLVSTGNSTVAAIVKSY